MQSGPETRSSLDEPRAWVKGAWLVPEPPPAPLLLLLPRKRGEVVCHEPPAFAAPLEGHEVTTGKSYDPAAHLTVDFVVVGHNCGGAASGGGRTTSSLGPRLTLPSVTPVSGRSGSRPDTMGDAGLPSARVQADGGTPRDAGRANA